MGLSLFDTMLYQHRFETLFDRLLGVKADDFVVYFRIVRQLAERSDVAISQRKKAAARSSGRFIEDFDIFLEPST